MPLLTLYRVYEKYVFLAPFSWSSFAAICNCFSIVPHVAYWQTGDDDDDDDWNFITKLFLHIENKHVPPLPTPHSFPLALPVASFALLSIRLIIKYSIWHEFSTLPATKCERDKNKERERKLKFVSFLRKKNSINCNRWLSVCCKMRILCCVWKAD